MLKFIQQGSTIDQQCPQAWDKEQSVKYCHMLFQWLDLITSVTHHFQKFLLNSFFPPN